MAKTLTMQNGKILSLDILSSLDLLSVYADPEIYLFFELVETEDHISGNGLEHFRWVTDSVCHIEFQN